MKRTLLLNLLILALCKFSFGCDCVGISYQEALETYELISTAKVLKITDDPKSCYNGYCAGVFVELEIINSYREANKKTITVYTNKSTASCGYPFELGKSYLVYATKKNENYSVSLCSRTVEIENAQGDIKRLNKDLKK